MAPIKYDALKQEILKHRGKVLLVDFWGGFCLPCMKNMPPSSGDARQVG